jgi:hypothetical protein
MTLILALLALQDALQFSEWDAWNACEVGSTVTIEMENSAMKGMKTKRTTTLLKKEAEKLTVRVEMETSGTKIPAQEQTSEKPKGGSIQKTDCPRCKKAWSTHGKWTKGGTEKVKIGDREVEAPIVEGKLYDCKGEKETGSSKSWVSKDVPGWNVRVEAKK